MKSKEELIKELNHMKSNLIKAKNRDDYYEDFSEDEIRRIINENETIIDDIEIILNNYTVRNVEDNIRRIKLSLECSSSSDFSRLMNRRIRFFECILNN